MGTWCGLTACRGPAATCWWSPVHPRGHHHVGARERVSPWAAESVLSLSRRPAAAIRNAGSYCNHSCPAICQIKLITSVGDSWECITTRQTPAHRTILVKEFEPQRVRTHSHGGKSPTRGYPKKRVTQHRAGERGSRGDSLAAPQRSGSSCQSWQSWQSWQSGVSCAASSRQPRQEAPRRAWTPRHQIDLGQRLDL